MPDSLTTEQRIYLFHAPYTAVALIAHAALFYVATTLGTGDYAWPLRLPALAPETRGGLAILYATTAPVAAAIACFTASQAADDIERAAREERRRDA
ncbi:hypothetical protein [Elioraea sp.]|uniref:hypothetical protein n=1 Tax=Elioraea sp. TaxID=2185103 RepID=UPI0025BE222D|nr:hypothetical protein [Elioraea sp.]